MREAQAQIAPGVAGSRIDARETIGAVVANAHVARWGAGRALGQKVDRATDRIAAIQRRCGAFDHFDTTGAVGVDGVERVVVEHAHRPNRDAVFQVLVNRLSADGLADAHAVLFVAQIVPKHAGNAVDDLAHGFGLVCIPFGTTDRADGHRSFRQFGLRA